MRRWLEFGCCSLAVLTLSGCQGVMSAGNMPQVRVIVASSDVPALDVYADANPIAYNLAFGNVTSYVPVSPGSYAVSAHAKETRQVLTAASTSFGGAAHYTILLGDTTANLQQSILRDQSTPAPAGQMALRFVNQAIYGGPVDVYLVPPAAAGKDISPVLVAQAFGMNSGYLNLPTGIYRVLLYPAGAPPRTPLNIGPLVNYPAGSVRTLLLLDQKLTGSALQVITATDFDPSSPAS